MAIKWLPVRGATTYSFGGGANDVRVLNEASTLNYWLDLGGGNDYALLAAGNDFVVGGKGSDFIQGGAGDDVIYGGLVDSSHVVRKSERDILVGDALSEPTSFGHDVIVGASGTTPGNPLRTEAYGDTMSLGSGQTGGDDEIFGGSCANNFLFGDAETLGPNSTGGADRMDSGEFTTTIMYGDGEFLSGGTTLGVDVATGGNDTLWVSGSSTAAVYGDGSELFFNSVGGDDRIDGGIQSFNTLVGDAGRMWDGSQGGNDTIEGGFHAGSNLLVGDAMVRMIDSSGVQAVCGDDVLYAGFADTDTTVMVGDVVELIDADTVFGDDLLYAGRGNDLMFGDFRYQSDFEPTVGGADYFVFDGGIHGHDSIGDFDAAEGDKIYLLVASDEDIAVLTSQIIITLDNGSDVIHLSTADGSLDYVRVVGVSDLQVGVDIIVATALPIL
jgi:Ca2+-binding RTX toxin-like protein